MLRPALISGVIFGVASSIPIIGFLNCFCCSLIFGCGILSAYLLIRQSSFPVLYGQGALVGLLAGFFGALTTTIMDSILEILIGPYLKNIAFRFLENVPEQIPPELMEVIEKRMMEPFTVSAMIISLIMSLIIFGIFSTLGGILGVALFGKRQKTESISAESSTQM